MSGESIGPYRILEPLREGGATAVFKAADAGGRTVALKVFSPGLAADPTAAPQATEPRSPEPAAAAQGPQAEIVARFHREIAAVSELRHPNILQVFATGEDGGRLYLASELFSGLSLERLLKQRRLQPAEAVAVMRGICRGLSYAHQRGFAHGHLSPRHVLVDGVLAQVKVADFGPSESEVFAAMDSTLRTGMLTLGALHYLAPEQAERRGAGGPGRVDPRSDLYAAGVIFHEMLTGRAPGGKFTLPSHGNADLPPAADVLVLKCLNRDPAQRYASAAALLADLDKLEEALRVRLLTHLRGISRLFPASGAGRRALLAAALALLLAALLVAGYLVLR
ncbi:MAG TPA: protein kinase [Thermoanaerobaculia bacterium]|nr:protein kinase [Thermoanaerobaculia bacterium]